MKILEIDESKIIIKRLFEKFEFKDLSIIDKYLKSRTKVILWLMNLSWQKQILPYLWIPNEEVKGIREIYPAYLLINNLIHNEKDGGVYNVFYTSLTDGLVAYLNKVKMDNIYCLSEWSGELKLNYGVLECSPDEIKDILIKNGSNDGYYFSKDLSWILLVGHHEYSILVGSQEFIDGFIDYFPDYKKYLSDFDYLAK